MKQPSGGSDKPAGAFNPRPGRQVRQRSSLPFSLAIAPEWSYRNMSKKSMPIDSTSSSSHASQSTGARQQTPHFTEHGKVYYADSCLPLVMAAEAGEVFLRAFGRYGYPGERMPEEILPGLSSVGLWDARQPQSWGLPEHRNEGVEFTFMETGQMKIRVESDPLPLEFDQLLITRPWQPHQLGDPRVSAGRLIWVIVDVGVRRPHQEWRWPSWIILQREDVLELTRYLRQNEQPLWMVSPGVRRCFESIASALQTTPPARSYSALAVSLNGLLLNLLELFRLQNIPLRESLTHAERSVRHFLEELKLCPEKLWTVETMAENCHLGVTRFVHYVRHLTNLSPAEYLMDCRMNLATRLLKENPILPLAEVAKSTGFGSSQYFIRVFRKRTGMTPGEYRKSGGTSVS
jgi:AraC-like DNA-binding protein